MIFALFDYLQYKTKRGRYDIDDGDVFSVLSHDGILPRETVDKLEIGDAILTQRMNSFFSWGLMYMTASSVDHVALYIGDGEIIHLTLRGVKQHSLNVFGRQTRVLPIRYRLNGKSNPQAEPPVQEIESRPRGRLYHLFPAKFHLVCAGLEIALGFYSKPFRLRALLDVVLILLCIDAALIWGSGLFSVPFLSATAVTIAATNRIRHYVRARLGYPPRELLLPELFFNNISSIGGLIFSRIGTLEVNEFGIMPLEFAAHLRREGSDDGADDDLEKSDELGSGLAENGVEMPSVQETENQNRD